MNIYYNQDIADRNTFGMKVSCGCLVEYDDAGEFAELAVSEQMKKFPRPFLHIGSGSNLLFTGDFPGTVFHSNIRFIKETAGEEDGNSTDVLVDVGAGTKWDDFCRWASERGLWGPENLSGIPGETGAAAVQNIGAYGVEIKDLLVSVRCFDAVKAEFRTVGNADCRYGYRSSVFKESAKGRYIVMSVQLKLSRLPHPRLDYGHVRKALEARLSSPDISSARPGDIRETVLAIRNSKIPDPSVKGNAGSFFKNPVVPGDLFRRVENYAFSRYGENFSVPHYDAGSGFVKIPAAWLIEQCGWKGYKEGNVSVCDTQPLVLLNETGNALPEEILALEKKITASVSDMFGIELHPEVEHIVNR